MLTGYIACLASVGACLAKIAGDTCYIAELAGVAYLAGEAGLADFAGSDIYCHCFSSNDREARRNTYLAGIAGVTDAVADLAGEACILAGVTAHAVGGAFLT